MRWFTTCKLRIAAKVCIIFFAVITLKDQVSISYLRKQQQDAHHVLSSSNEQQVLKEEHYKALALHEEGHWEHAYTFPDNHNSVNITDEIRDTYLPIEIDWLKGINLPSYKWNKRFRINPNNESNGLMYQSNLGNQYGYCPQPDFQPSISKWISTSHKQQHEHSTKRDDIASPTLRLIQRLAKSNATMCLVGDSIDYQFYDALRHNLHRQQHLQSDIKLKISTQNIPVNYTNQTGWPPHRYWMTMDSIKETIVSLTDAKNSNATRTAIIRYFQMYGWSPWDVPHTDDCNIDFKLGLALQCSRGRNAM